MKDMTKKERAEMWQQVAAYVEQLERAVEAQRAQLKRRQERINKLKECARTERVCGNLWRTGFMCTECGTSVTGLNTINYCPNCGRKVVS